MTIGSSNGWHVRQPLGVADALHLGEGLTDVRPVQDDPGAVAAAGVDLRVATAPAGMTTVTATPAARPAHA